jgi:SAM-dependent methyltransferase
VFPLNITDLINRNSPPIPWAEGDNIPWNEPGFSRRMLKEHLSQAHDAASRRFETIDRQVEWIHTMLLAQQPTTILDLGCGPGFYTERLSHLGHTCHGIDYSPASIEYAIQTASLDKANCTYICQDIRQAVYPRGFGLVMLIYGEFNVFRPADAAQILAKAWQALEPGGVLLLESHPFQVVQGLGEKPPSWYSSRGGLFSDVAHIVLRENFWEADAHVATNRYYIVDADTGQVTRYAQSMQAYADDEYRGLLSSQGFGQIQLLPGLLGQDSPKDFIAVLGRKL